MTDKKTEALKLALEALECIWDDGLDGYPESMHSKAITAIREALAEHPAQQQQQQCMEHGECFGGECIYPATQPAQQEPVAYAVYHRMGGSKTLHWPEQHSEDGDHNEYQLVPLYTSPPIEATPLASQSRSDVKPWVGLSTDEIYDMYNEPRSDAEMVEFARAIEAKLKEKNSQ